MNNKGMIKAYAQRHIGAPYVYGATGQRCTPDYRRARMAQYPSFAEAIQKNCPVLSGRQPTCSGCKHNGRLAFDCAQLTRRAAEAIGLSLPSGSKSQWTKGNWALKGPIADLPSNQEAFLFNVKPDGGVPHTGIALGDGTAVDARGHFYGVMHKPIGSYPWTHFAILRGQTGFEGVPSPVEPAPPAPPADSAVPSNPATPTPPNPKRLLRAIRGSKLQRGPDVLAVQRRLLELGYSVGVKGADGIYGWDTQRAVLAFQMAAFLASRDDWDGVVGPRTLAKLAG